MTDRRPSPGASEHVSVCHRARQPRNKHEDFGGVAESIMAQRKPATDIPWDVVDEDEPECNASAGIEPNVAVWHLFEWTPIPWKLAQAHQDRLPAL